MNLDDDRALLMASKQRAARAMLEAGPYRLVDDDSGHWYVIPVRRSLEWNAWVGGDDWALGNCPPYAKRVNGPQSIEFFVFEMR